MHVRRLRTGLVGAVAVLATIGSGLLAGHAAAAEGRPGPASIPGSFTGYAFDARCAPTQEQMDAWLTSSPFWGVGIYIGGSTMSCRPEGTDPGQPHLDAGWVERQTVKGWRLLPLWVGPQASCSSYADRIDPAPRRSYAAAAARGRREAAAAVTRARELGIPRRSTLWYDLEGGFDVADDDCRRSALRFLSAWTTSLHSRGFRSGVYSSVSAGIHALDNADKLSPGSYTMPDRVWYAWYNNRSDTRIDPTWVRRGSWAGERVHQYAAQQVATYGDVALTIDRNYLDLGQGSVAPRVRRYCGGTSLDLRRYPTLRRGDRGEAVRVLQCLLRREAGYRGRIDGAFDRDVVRAVRDLQSVHSLEATGTVAAEEWVVLHALGGTPLLKAGSAEEAVRRVQRALTAALGRRVAITGVFTPGTAAALQRYQVRVGLFPTGVVADDTWAALQR